jgi:hypothetical protein
MRSRPLSKSPTGPPAFVVAGQLFEAPPCIPCPYALEVGLGILPPGAPEMAFMGRVFITIV